MTAARGSGSGRRRRRPTVALRATAAVELQPVAPDDASGDAPGDAPAGAPDGAPATAGERQRDDCEILEVIANQSWFTRFTKWVSRLTGRPAAFVLAVFTIAAWAISGPAFHFSSDWQLVVNTGTTIVTFLMVFLIQSTQNRDTQAIHIKLDELIRATRGAHNTLLDLEEMEEAELDRFRGRYEALAQRARGRGTNDAANGTPELDD